MDNNLVKAEPGANNSVHNNRQENDMHNEFKDIKSETPACYTFQLQKLVDSFQSKESKVTNSIKKEKPFNFTDSIKVENVNMSKMANAGKNEKIVSTCEQTFGDATKHEPNYPGKTGVDSCINHETTQSMNTELNVRIKLEENASYSRNTELDMQNSGYLETSTEQTELETLFECQTTSTNQHSSTLSDSSTVDINIGNISNCSNKKLDNDDSCSTFVMKSTCATCGKEIDRHIKRNSHMIHLDSVYSECSEQQHYKTVYPNLKKFSCTDCGQQFLRKKYLGRHICSVHLKLNYSTCDECGKQFSQKHHLNEHKKSVHLKLKNHLKLKKLSCTDCGQQFSGKNCLYHHIRSVHLKLLCLTCNECGKQFSRKPYLNQHKKSVHQKLKNYLCNECGIQFSQNCQLNQHNKSVHLKLKNHTCNECGKQFSRKTSLDRHNKAVHLKLKNYKCNDCGKHFSERGGLNKHKKRIHLKLKNHTCNECGKQFSLKCKLNQHKKSVHKSSRTMHVMNVASSFHEGVA